MLVDNGKFWSSFTDGRGKMHSYSLIMTGNHYLGKPILTSYYYYCLFMLKVTMQPTIHRYRL
jgi:hypothetical protein